MSQSPPLVSIGLPTCNRAHLLETAVRSLLAQDYPNLEIIISDNVSDDATPALCERLQREDARIRHVRQPARVPAMANFKNALIQARGPLFLWASDDDLWEPTFVTTLFKMLEDNPSLVLAMCETQYRLSSGVRLPFFEEGRFWQQPPPMTRFERLLAVADHNYGDLIYGLYRREVLLTPSGTVLDHWNYLNEIPMFLSVASRGEIQVCPQILFLKTVGLNQYLGAAREYDFFPKASLLPPGLPPACSGSLWQRLRALVKTPKRALHHRRYHQKALQDIAATIDLLGLTPQEKQTLSERFKANFHRHWIKLAFTWNFEDAFGPRRII